MCETGDVDIFIAAGIPGHKVGGVRLERDHVTVQSESAVGTGRVRLRSVRLHAHAVGVPFLEIAHVDVTYVIAVCRIVGKTRVEDHEPAVAADVCVLRGTIRLSPVVGKAREDGHTGRKVSDEDILPRVRIADHEVFCLGFESDQVPVVGDGRAVGDAVA